MSQAIRLGILGAGWPGRKHAEGAKASGGYKLAAVADLIPARRQEVMSILGTAREMDDAADVIRDKAVDAVCIALPNHLHVELACAALRAGKHVLIEKPPAINAREARRIAAAAEKSGKVVLYAFQRRFGPTEQAANAAIARGYTGEVYHARAAWLRTRGIPVGTGWFFRKQQSGGGAMIDIGVHLLDLAWWLMGKPKPISVFAATHSKFAAASPDPAAYDVDDSAFALLRFENGRSLELAASWALNQPPQQQGTTCRLFGERGCVDVYTPDGAVIHRQFNPQGQSQSTALKPPRLVGHAALMRHFRECILGKAKPLIGPADGVAIMEMIDAIYRSAETGKSVSL